MQLVLEREIHGATLTFVGDLALVPQCCSRSNVSRQFPCRTGQNFPELNQLNSLRHGESVLVSSPMTRHHDEHHNFLQSASPILPHPFFQTQFPMTPWLEPLERLVFPTPTDTNRAFGDDARRHIAQKATEEDGRHLGWDVIFFLLSLWLCHGSHGHR